MRGMLLAPALGLGLGLTAIACSEGRPARLGTQTCDVHYEQGAGPVLTANCAECHGPARAEGDYRVDSYEGAIARSPTGEPRAARGDEGSLILAAAQGSLGDHAPIAESDVAILKQWVVDCGLSPRPYLVHAPGLLDPANADEFHGLVLRRALYDTSACQDCHGTNLSGGTSQVSCKSCHADGVNACDTCHGSAGGAAPPRDLDGLTSTTRLGVGAHQTHQRVACSSCHAVPETAEAEGHYVSGGEFDHGPAEVRLESSVRGTAQWDRATATCTNSRCHAPAEDARATNQAPVWTRVGEDQAACGTCHGTPPASHGATSLECRTCHAPAYDEAGELNARHVDGDVQVVAGVDSCVGCHGSGDQPAPPLDLAGESAETRRSVGAHRAHLEARRRLSQKIACAECHVVPATLFSPGHVDSIAPAEVVLETAGVLARADGAPASYDAVAGTCTSYCHGSGDRLARDTAPGINRTPSWTQGVSQASCGSCHGVPPRIPGTTYHASVTSLLQCANCHPGTMTPQGTLRVTLAADGSPITKHLDGVVQTGP